MEKILSEVEEAFARLTMLEYVCEIVLANQLAQTSQESSEAAKAKMIELMNRPSRLTAEPDAADAARSISERSAEMMEKFISRVANREAEIRK